MGRPEEVAAVEASHTGRWLRTVLKSWSPAERPGRAKRTARTEPEERVAS
jgi:hypothetical protein